MHWALGLQVTSRRHVRFTRPDPVVVILIFCTLVVEEMTRHPRAAWRTGDAHLLLDGDAPRGRVEAVRGSRLPHDMSTRHHRAPPD